ncbi:response regulator transcription factor [bacterium]|nr:response regulator transcription factor [bacterium]
MNNIRILLVDDHKIVREGYRTLLANERGMEVVGEADDGRAAIAACRKLTPDVVVMDITMPNLNGVEATRLILEEMPKVRVVILSMHGDKRFVTSALKSGATGFLMKDCAFEELADAIRTAARGQTYLSPKVTGIVVDDYVRRVTNPAPVEGPRISPREREVLQLVAEGKPTREIAEVLHLSVKTVETHRQQIMLKLDLHSVAELTKYAIREGITTLEK